MRILHKRLIQKCFLRPSFWYDEKKKKRKKKNEAVVFDVCFIQDMKRGIALAL